MTDTPAPASSRFCRLCAFVLAALVVGVLVLLVLVLNPPTPPTPPDYAKLPLVTDYDWDQVTGSGWNYAQRTGDRPSAILPDAAAPVSPSNVLSIDFTGTNQDTEPGVHYHALPSAREVYAEWWIKFSANWTCAPAGCGKVSFFYGSSGGDAYMGVYCDVPQANWPGQAASCPENNWLMPDHFVVGGQLQFGEYGGWPLLANVTRTRIVRDRWYHFAHYLKWSSTPTATDGIWRIYVDDVLNLERTDLAITMGPAIEFQFAPTRQPPPPPDEKLWIDHTIVRAQ